MRLTQTLSDAVDEQKYVGAVFFDLKKAFYRVWHKGLLAKIRFAGVTGGAHEWLASYLSERHQVTLVDGQLLSTNKLHAGVPQGAILSPLLFCVFMNDMPCRDSTNLFADDTSSYVIESNAAKLEEKFATANAQHLHLVFQMASLCEHRKISNHGFSFSENVTCLCASFHRQEHYTPGQFSSTLGPHPSRVSILGLPYRSRCIEGFGEAWLPPALSKSSRPACHPGSLHVLHPSCS